ncbi:hypothetical protein [Brevibacillus laterosporus]|uniref:hypothetical protein n=1 Tax=Brevibacillus laterosporus TaxID=1465 RepID=UPI0015863CCD|nr:hypothetical protein [Brevibacillus laterosporus]
MPKYIDAITEIQAGIYLRHGIRTDAYYQEGYGLLIVPEGAPLIPRNVIVTYDEGITSK